MDLQQIIARQHAFFKRGQTRDAAFREAALRALLAAVRSHEDAIAHALREDLGKCAAESYMTETGIVLNELTYAIRHVRHWARPVRVPTPLSHFPARSLILHEPYGTVLVLSPWNYPLQLSLAPVIGAIAAGNTVVLKPSAKSPHTSRVLRQILGIFPQEFVCCLAPDAYGYDELLAQSYDFIFFTGSERVGKLVMAEAAQQLTPVALELGGKSPCVVDETADIPLAARRIAWGKFLNAGQTCVAPDYVLAHRSVKARLVEGLRKEAATMYGDACHNLDYPRIVSRPHFDRLRALAGSCDPGYFNEAALKIAPLILDADWDDEIMREEIFGPILPVLVYDKLPEAVEQITRRPKPLALYGFTRSRAAEETLLALPFGGGCINDVVMHIGSHHLPFGGVGASGMGRYHGKHSFDCFSCQKSVLIRANRPDIPVRYHPFTARSLAVLKKLL